MADKVAAEKLLPPVFGKERRQWALPSQYSRHGYWLFLLPIPLPQKGWAEHNYIENLRAIGSKGT